MRVQTATLCVLLIGVCGAGAAQDAGSGFWERLQALPPTAPMAEERVEALRALDEWLAEPDSELSAPVVAYYQRAVDHALTTLEEERVKRGVRIFQLYSSSAIVQTPETVFAIDLDQGPNKRLSATPEEEGVAFRMTPQQIQRVVHLVDVSFHTHEHYDHVDFELTRALVDAGKTVVVTESNKRRWEDQPWAGKLVTLGQTLTEPHVLGHLKVDVLHDFQWDDEQHTSGCPCSAYLITTEDSTGILTKGDINCALRLYGWLNLMVNQGRRVDVMIGTPLFWRGVDLGREIDALLEPVWAVGHVWEFTHRSRGKRGGATGTYSGNYATMRRKAQDGVPVMLSWGEHIDITPRKKFLGRWR